MTEEEKQAAAKAEQEKAEAESKETKDSAEAKDIEIDYKAIAEANEALAKAEKERADAAEALITKNKNIQKRQEAKDDEERPLTRKDLEAIIPEILKNTKEDESDESKKLLEAQNKVKEVQAKNAEIVRALKGKDSASNNSIETQRDGLPKQDPKLPENSPLKEYKYEGNGIYSKKLKNGQTLYRNTKALPGQPKTFVK